MKRKLLTAVVGVTALTIATVAVYAAGKGDDKPGRGPGPEMGMFHPGMMGPQLLHRLGDELELTDEQRQTIKGLLESARPNMQAMREQARESAELLRKTQPDDPNYTNVVAQASQQAAELAGRLVTDGSQLRSQIWTVLTPEQRTELQTLQDKFPKRVREHRLHHRPSAPPAAAPSAMLLDESADYPAITELPMVTVTATRIRT